MIQTRLIHAISGPRNISTALMYSFAQRPGCVVIDEPFYGPYLQRTGLDHPGRTEILAQLPRTPIDCIAKIEQFCQQGSRELYLKNMAHHMVGMPWEWAKDAVHIFWIRHPRKVIRSFAKVWPQAQLADIGIVEQVEQWQRLNHFQGPKLIVDSDEMLVNPKLAFPKILTALGLSYYEAMLNWEPGEKPYDGPWAPYWYKNVQASQEFGPPSPPGETLTGQYLELEQHALPYYEELWDQRLILNTP